MANIRTLTYDGVIVGGGGAGMRAALQLAQSGYKTERTLDVLEKLAQNDSGAASAFAGAGLGLGAGLNLGNEFANLTQNTNTTSNNSSVVDRLKSLKELLDSDIITKDDYENKKKSILEEL